MSFTHLIIKKMMHNDMIVEEINFFSKKKKDIYFSHFSHLTLNKLNIFNYLNIL